MSEMIERVARAIWNIRREEEDKCDMELEDMGEDHEVWAEARAAMTVIAEWLETQRTDVPAHGWEFAAALKES